MLGINKVTLIGFVGQTPDVRQTSNGTTVANFSLATNERFKDKSGEVQTRTEWHSLTAWGKLAELVQQYVASGTRLYVEGKLQTQEYDDKEGNRRRKTVVIVQNLLFLSSKGERGEYDDSDVPATSSTDEQISF